MIFQFQVQRNSKTVLNLNIYKNTVFIFEVIYESYELTKGPWGCCPVILYVLTPNRDVISRSKTCVASKGKKKQLYFNENKSGQQK